MKTEASQKTPDSWSFAHHGFAAEWFDGLPLGNGDLGALMMTHHKETRFPIAKSDLWDERCDNGSGERGSCYPFRKFEELRKLVAKGDWDSLDAAFEEQRRKWKGNFALLPAGTLSLDTSRFEKEVEVLSVSRELNMQTAEAEGVLRSRVRSFQINALVSTDHQVLAAQVDHTLDWRSGNPPRPMAFGMDVSFDIQPSDPEASIESGFSKSILWRRVRGYHEIDYTLAVLVKGLGVRVALDRIKNRLVVTSSGRAKFSIFMTAASGAEGKAEAISRLGRAAREGFARIKADHRKWWKMFWKASEVAVPDTNLLRQYHFGLYQLASSSRKGFRMPGLQGLWYTRKPGSAWNEYTNDLNIQMCYWPIYASNHLELGWPYYDTVAAWLPESRKYTKEYWGCDGVQFSCCCSPTGIVPLTYLTVMHCAGNSAFVAQNFWTHYRFSRDGGFLRNVAYPMLKECAEFYLGFLRKDRSGRYEIWPSCTPEAGEGSYEAWGKNTTMDIALVKMLFSAVVEAAEILNQDAEFAAACAERLRNLPAYPMSEGAVIDMESKEFLYSHRHNGMITPIYPCADLSGAVAKRTIDRFNARGKWMWGCHTVPWQAAAEARVGRGRAAWDLLREFIETWTAPQGGFNLNFDYHRTGRGIPGPAVLCNESVSGFSAAMLEMLLQSHKGLIKVFPAIPGEWREVGFKNLRADGAFLVSAQRRSGTTEWVKIASEQGGVLRLRSPWKNAILTYVMKPGQSFVLKPD